MMAPSWQEVASQQAEQIANRLRELMSSGVVFLHTELGVDLGLKPEHFPQWVILLTPCIGLLIMMVLWMSVSRGISKQRSVTPLEETREITTESVKTAKPEEPKKKNKKKSAEKKLQTNGRVAVEVQEEVKVATEIKPQEQPEIKTDKAKKNKKKAKAVIKEAKTTPSTDGKEPDEGAWETKVSNREKRQQRRKDKPTSDSSASPGGPEPTSSVPAAEQPKIAIPSEPSSQKKNKENKGEPSRAKPAKAEAVVPQAVTPRWDEVIGGTDGGWNDLGLKLSAQIPAVEPENWTPVAQSSEQLKKEPLWSQEMEGSWTFVDGIQNPVPFTRLSATPAAGDSQAIPDLSWACQPLVDDEWSGLNGTTADSSDWNAPSVEWGNYVEPQPECTPTPVQPVTLEVQVSDEEKDKGETAAPGSGKAKKKKKKKKKAEDAGTNAQEEAEKEVSAAGPGASVQPTALTAPAAAAEIQVEVQSSVKQTAPVHVPQRPAEPEATGKKGSAAAATQKKPEENWESKQVKKKKARRET
ncbi:protein LYRIC isoform X2 [Chanos chanos]|uniref:Protein LYRIC isoform X2 n=1 Tax=Chanos chanos TaxID=29144 RepID=A0A6J2W4Z9_CHACN|nr:protein LYRIC-like isoform X2 [Chanos chanos]